MGEKKKPRKLINKEKRILKALRAEWREKGILPPVKPKLNRKKFAKEVIAEFADSFGAYTDISYLYKAIRWMTPVTESKIRIRVSSEEVGVLKMLKLAMEIKKFEESVKAKGETRYKIEELYEKVVAPVLNL